MKTILFFFLLSFSFFSFAIDIAVTPVSGWHCSDSYLLVTFSSARGSGSVRAMPIYKSGGGSFSLYTVGTPYKFSTSLITMRCNNSTDTISVDYPCSVIIDKSDDTRKIS